MYKVWLLYVEDEEEVIIYSIEDLSLGDWEKWEIWEGVVVCIWR